ncbi:MAG TPA: ion channel, partial [Methylomirabilota bacterium]|nr:ion channel [Methylomirabilota bacterium]
MTALGWLEVVAGIVLVVGTFYDLFKSVVLPRPSINRFVMVRLLFFAFWMFWQWVGRRIQNVARRESWLATFGPSAVIAMFLTWALAFMLGYALILDGLRTQVRPLLDGFGESLYFSATTIVPLSYGDFVPIGAGARVMILFESATGVGIAA